MKKKIIIMLVEKISDYEYQLFLLHDFAGISQVILITVVKTTEEEFG
jgi:hypothetical protein